MKITLVPSSITVTSSSVASSVAPSDLPCIANNPAALRIWAIWGALKEALSYEIPADQLTLDWSEGKFSWVLNPTAPDIDSYTITIKTVQRYLKKAGFLPITEATPLFVQKLVSHLNQFPTLAPPPSFFTPFFHDLYPRIVEYLNRKEFALFFKAIAHTQEGQQILRTCLQSEPKHLVAALTIAYQGLKSTPHYVWEFLQKCRVDKQAVDQLTFSEDDLPFLKQFMPMIRELSLLHTYIDGRQLSGTALEELLQYTQELQSLTVQVQDWTTTPDPQTTWISHLQHFVCYGHQVTINFTSVNLKHLKQLQFQPLFQDTYTSSIELYTSAPQIVHIQCQGLKLCLDSLQSSPYAIELLAFDDSYTSNFNNTSFQFNQFPEVRELSLTTTITDTEITWPTSGLEKLQFTGEEDLSTSFYTCLAQNQSLKQLSLSQVEMQEFEAGWPDCPELRELTITTPLTTFKAPKNLLSACPQLQILHIASTLVDDGYDINFSEVQLPHLPLQLITLKLFLSLPLPILEEWLCNMPKLQELDLDVTRSDLHQFQHTFPSIQKLSIFASDAIDELPNLVYKETSILSLLTSCPNIQELTLHGLEITPENWRGLSFSKLRELQLINVDCDTDNSSYNPSHFSIECFPNLEVLILEGPNLMTIKYSDFMRARPQQLLKQLKITMFPGVELNDVYSWLLTEKIPARALTITQRLQESAITLQEVTTYVTNNPHLEHLSLDCELGDHATFPAPSITIFETLQTISVKAPKSSETQIWNWIGALQRHPKIELTLL